ncbi:hypothetical protein [Burkholderia ubonensis]|uniref:hypothetical protein n=1 Tax=Burkholderia ubonensis TaxID=101571 RepID=UPI000B2B29F7|nr:hypothetical protein [Burkholderia ubonensis]
MALTSTLFGGVSIGKDTSGNLKLGFTADRVGLAVRSPDGQWYVKDGDGLRNVTGATVDVSDGWIFRLPVSEVHEGDVVVVSDDPFSAVFVRKVGTEGQLQVLNPAEYSSGEFTQPTNLFGQRYYVKAVSLLDSLGDLGNENSLFFLLMLSRGDTTGKGDNLLPLLMLQKFQGDDELDKNVLLALLLQNDQSNALEALLLMQALGGGQKGRRPRQRPTEDEDANR